MKAWAAWQDWWFRAADPRMLALMRIGFGLVALYTYLPMWDDLGWLITDQGVQPIADRESTSFSLYANDWWSLRTLAEVRMLYGSFLMVLFGILIGFRSRILMPLAWIGIWSLSYRNMAMADGSDAILRVMGFYLMFLPTSRTWSIDAIRGWVGTGDISSFWLRMFQLNVAIVYVKTGLVKVIQPLWQNGDSLYYAMQAEAYWRFPMEPFLQNEAFRWFTEIATYGTLVFEIGFPLVFFARLRRPVLLAGLALHAGIWVFMNLGSFSEVMLWTYTAFLVLPKAKSSG
ncbi:MAG: HTTM domain-containing protein [Proteobacteria bacterium]|nr:HTTM domain-containing protein [Pseudomonadota bacterium]